MAIQFKRGSSTSRSSSTDVLKAGQPFYEKDTKKVYVGDGTAQLKDLVAITGGGDVTATGDNTFTGTNTFSKHVALTFGPEGYADFGNGLRFWGNHVTKIIDNTQSYNLTFPTNKTGLHTFAMLDDLPVANPTAEGTTTLTKLKIGDVIYAIPSGDVTAAGSNIFTNTNTFEQSIKIGRSDLANTLYDTDRITITQGAEKTILKLPVISEEGGAAAERAVTLATTNDLPDTSTFVALANNNEFTGRNTFAGTSIFKVSAAGFNGTTAAEGVTLVPTNRSPGAEYMKLGFRIGSPCIGVRGATEMKNITYTFDTTKAAGNYWIASKDDIPQMTFDSSTGTLSITLSWG